MLIKLVIAVKDIERATSPLANFVSTFEVTPPGAAAINITPNANSTGVLKIIIKKYATMGSNTSWQNIPIKKSLGLWATLVKSFTVKDAPSPSMISANAIGAIVVTIPMTPLYKVDLYNIENFYYEIKKFMK